MALYSSVPAGIGFAAAGSGSGSHAVPCRSGIDACRQDHRPEQPSFMSKRAKNPTTPRKPSAPPTDASVAQRTQALLMAGRYLDAFPLANTLAGKSTPTPAECHLIGWTLLGLGKPRDALPWLERAKGALAREALFLVHLGLALHRLGDYDAAEAWLDKALKRAPRDARQLVAIGQQLSAAFRYREAARWFQRAAEIAPGNVDARLQLAHVQLRRGDDMAARATIEAALTAAPRDAGARLAHANILSTFGDFEAADGQLRALLAETPDSAQILAQLVSNRRMTDADRDIQGRLERCAARPGRPDDRIASCFALGKFSDDIGRYDEAFSWFAQGNAMKRSLAPPYDPDTVTRTVDLLTAAYSEAGLRELRPGSDLSPKPVLVVGMPRSGTSLVQDMLAAHPDIHGAGEQSFWGEMLDRYRQAVFMGQLSPAMLADITRATLDFLNDLSDGAARIIDKMPANFRFLGPVHTAFPNARFIHVTRDPRDTCLSIHFQNFGLQHTYATDLTHLAHYYRQYQRLMAHWARSLPPDRLLEVPYESLVEAPEDWTRRMIAFLDLPWSDACLKRENLGRSVATASKWQVRQPIYQTSRRRWQNYRAFLAPLSSLAPDTPA
ncbi:MAG: sulfotransferase [Rhodocyclaceae bacterium]|nr:sulfotransferase [Rhodocyclaceae bacterium]